MLYDCSADARPGRDVNSTPGEHSRKSGFFSSPITIVLIVWGLMFVGLGLVLAYD
jgi:hypothetical protein